METGTSYEAGVSSVPFSQGDHRQAGVLSYNRVREMLIGVPGSAGSAFPQDVREHIDRILPRVPRTDDDGLSAWQPVTEEDLQRAAEMGS